MSSPLVAVAEGRELEKLAAQLEAGGASVLRCPMLTMTDPEDGAPLAAFIGAVIAGEIDDILFMTGEGVERFFAHAAREGREAALISALRGLRRIARGSKAVRELKTRGLAPEFSAEPPTTEGVLAAWSTNPPAGRRVGVVRSGDEIAGAEAWLAKTAASVHPVSSYTYGPASDSAAVADLLGKLSRGEVRVLALTSIAQARALMTASDRAGAPLSSRLTGTLVASIGPSLTAFLTEHGIRVALQPEDRHFLAPFSKTILAALKA
jgi:uroporphyrinogen-III synthase